MSKPPEPPEPPIHRAARLGDLIELRRLLDAGADINARADLEVDNGPYLRQLTPLMVAARSVEGASVQTIEFLLHRGADLHAESEGGNTAAWYAAGKGGRWDFHEWRLLPDHVDRMRLLLDSGLKASECNFVGRSLITEACSAGDPARLKLLLERGAEHTPPAAIAQTEGFRQGIGESWNDRFRKAIDAGLNVHEMMDSMMGACTGGDAVTSSGIPLLCAATSGSAACVRLLLNAGASPHLLDQSRRTALMYAGSPEVARELLGAGASVAETDENDHDVLEAILRGSACEAGLCGPGRFAVARIIMEAMGQLEEQRLNHARLYDAAFRHDADTVDFLLGLGWNARGNPECSPLHGICWQGEYKEDSTNHACERIIRSLVTAGADVNAQDDEGATPLHQAASGDWGNQTAIRVLLELGAAADPVDQHGDTPLMLAASKGETECLLLLLQAGADPERKSSDGTSALDAAEEHLGTCRMMNQQDAPQVDLPPMALPGFDQSAIWAESLKNAVSCDAILKEAASKRRSAQS